jgi:hypothetical protein
MAALQSALQQDFSRGGRSGEDPIFRNLDAQPAKFLGNFRARLARYVCDKAVMDLSREAKGKSVARAIDQMISF